MPSIAPSTCEKENCISIAMGEDSFCHVCKLIMCREHYDALWHHCGYSPLTSANSIQQSLADLDESAVRSRIEQLRPNVPFGLVIPNTSDEWDKLSGSFNYHIEVKFEDGIEWLVRLSAQEKGQETVGMVQGALASEMLTYQLLRDNGIPVPAIHDWGFSDFSKTKNPLCRFTVYDRVPGVSSSEIEVALSKGEMSEEDMRVFVKDFAEISIKLSNIKFEAIGSLMRNKEGNVVCGPHLSIGQDYVEAPFYGEPFRTVRERYLHRIDSLIGLIKRGLIHRRSPLLHFLAFMEARRLVESDLEMGQQESEFYIRHPDCSGNNVMSKDGRITGLIDWEWTATTTKAAAFAAPQWAYETKQVSHMGEIVSPKRKYF